MKVLVTGGAGYIGSHVVIELCEAGYDVVVFDDLSLGHRENVDHRAIFIKGSTLNDDSLATAFLEKPDAVIHLAAWKAAGESMTDPGKYAQNNIIGTINLLNAMCRFDVKTFVFSSTAAVYGYPQYLPVDEKHPVNPINYYGYTKLVIEENLKWYSELKGIRFAALRYFNAAGYDIHGRVRHRERNPQNLLPIVMEIASGERKHLDIYGNDYDTPDGTGVRDYIHVNDLASAHVQALKYLKDKCINLTVNLATGVGYSVLDVAYETESVTGQRIPYNIVDRRPGDPAELIAVSKEAEKILNWQPRYSDLTTLLKTMWTLYSS
ncbi:MAG: UDP-glucose 4-epimerase GalE [Candidatus Marinimicrobia bacterium]|nr:UDP-glucose 4-epimerase GalE [Candidatus Neomarinimicrobiota bacterium]MBL7059657.1 UDP-glucose 4-epimerase GalE [Candidatus Neomarinimicrobiota bacterium]